MGNKQSIPPEAIALRNCSPLVRSRATTLRVEHLHNTQFHVYDQDSSELLFQVTEEDLDEPNERMLMDAKNQPVVKIEERETRKSFDLLFKIKSRAAPHRELYKIETWTRDFISGIKLKFADENSGEKFLIEAESDSETSSSVVFLARGDAADKKRKLRLELRELICEIASRDGGYDVQVVAGVDLMIVALFCHALHRMVVSRIVFKVSVDDDQVAGAAAS
ncbi:hypothetical protein Gpo141_00004523 [Globisporangium polare]